MVLIRSAVTHTWTLLRRFKADPAVTAASRNYWRRIDAMPPDDPGLAAQWGLLKTGVPDAWRLRAAMIAPLQSWIVCQTAVLTPKITGWPLARLTEAEGNSRMMPVTAKNRKATSVTMSTQ